MSSADTAESFRQTLQVRNPQQAPPGGWRCRIDETGVSFSNPAFSQLETIVATYLSECGMDPAEAGPRIHQTTAKVLVSGGHKELVAQLEKVERTPSQYAAGARAKMLLWWAESPIHGLLRGKFNRGEEVFVPMEEANRRAAICADCEEGNRVPTGKGWLQNWTDNKMLESVMDRKTEHHDRLGVCKICGGCELRAAVHWPADILRKVTPEMDAAKYPNHCWKKQIILNPS